MKQRIKCSNARMTLCVNNPLMCLTFVVFPKYTDVNCKMLDSCGVKPDYSVAHGRYR